VIEKLTKKPAVAGHSFGGLLAQIVAGRGLSTATVAVDPAPFRGVLPLPISSLRSASPVLGNPANWSRAITRSLKQFKYGWANALSDDEAKQLHGRAGSHGAVGDRQRVVQEAATEPGCHRSCEGPEPQPCAHDRQWLAGGRRQGARVRAALHLNRSVPTSRLEAFSDGVFAIAITLLVLEIPVPHVEHGKLADRLLDQWPAYAAYVVSFAGAS
jgi:pimeloyl-ACP methyl ester carboxylesterase